VLLLVVVGVSVFKPMELRRREKKRSNHPPTHSL
jgi:hypothetical protein